jgi:hypothetical protein
MTNTPDFLEVFIATPMPVLNRPFKYLQTVDSIDKKMA